MQSRDYDAVVLVHGVGDGEHQGDFLVDVTEPLLRWVGQNGGEIAARTQQSLRRGERPPRREVSGTIPDRQHEEQRREFEWHFVEARWSDEFRSPPARSALGWSRRAYPEVVADQLCYYDSVWRFWRLLARLPSAGPAFRWLANGPQERADGDQRAWQYRYRVQRSRRYKYLYALWFGLIAPLLLLAGASVALLPFAPVASQEVVSQAGRRSPQGDLLRTTLPMQVDVRDHRIILHEGLTNVEEDDGGHRERGRIGAAPQAGIGS